MSGIAGYLNLNTAPVDANLLASMTDSLAHRGPDGAKTWHDGMVGLGHRMLWTTPESLHESLPFQSGSLVITADARIDNRDDLLRQLDFGGRKAETIADSEIILAAYQRWGAGCAEKLLGDFAFAIWDGRTQSLFCARDVFGVKPFYYHHAPGQRFAFGSEIKALLCLPDTPRELNEVMIGDYLSLMFEDKMITFYQDIFRLPPAHHLTINRDGLRLNAYWRLNPEFELHLRSDEDYHEQYRELFTEAVRCRMRSAYPVGTALSGGLDSSSIACVARDLRQQDGGQPLPTFSLVFDDVPESDERRFMEAVHAKGGFEPHFIHGDQVSPLGDFEQVVWQQDNMPFFAPQLFLHRALWGKAQQQGVRVFLDGLIGDNATSQGTGYLYELARHGRWIRLAQELRGAAPLWSAMPVWLRWWGFVRNCGIKPLIPPMMLKTYRKLRGYQPPTWSPPPIVNPDFARRIGLQQRMESLENDVETLRPEQQMHYRLLIMGLIPYGLEMSDKAAAPFTVEPRYPFTDRRVAEFCLALPSRLKFHHGYGRLIARNGLAHTLPDQIRWRYSKGDVGPNFSRGLLRYDGERLKQTAYEPCPETLQYVRQTTVQTYVNRLVEKSSGAYVRPLWVAVMLDQLIRHQAAVVQKAGREVIAAPAEFKLT